MEATARNAMTNGKTASMSGISMETKPTERMTFMECYKKKSPRTGQKPSIPMMKRTVLSRKQTAAEQKKRGAMTKKEIRLPTGSASKENDMP